MSNRWNPPNEVTNLRVTRGLYLDGVQVTASAAELNALDGMTASAAELSILEGVTSSAAELNILDGVTATAAEINKVDGLAAGGYLHVSELRSFTETAGAGTYTGSVVVPAGSLLIDIKVWSTVLWDNSGTAVMKVGDTDDDGWYVGINLKATDLLVGEEINFVQTGGKQGTYLDTSTGKRSAAWLPSGATIAGIVTTSSTGGGAGRSFMLVEYVTPVATAATKV